MPTVVLHIGRAKTGTSALQAQLSRIRKPLLDLGVHYVFADDLGSGSGHQNLAKSLMTTRPPFMLPPSNPEIIKKDVVSEIAESEADTILLSSENFMLCDPEVVKQFFLDIPSVNNVKILIYVRSQDEVAESQYKQLAKLNLLDMSFRQYSDLESPHKYESYHEIASLWGNCFGDGNVICKIYDPDPGKLLHSFFQSMLPGENIPGEFAIAPVVNDSIGYFELEFTMLLNKMGHAHAHVQNELVRSRFLNIDFPALLFDVDQAEAYRARYYEDNMRFSSRFLGVPLRDLGGRKYTDERRAAIRQSIRGVSAYELLEALNRPSASAPSDFWIS